MLPAAVRPETLPMNVLFPEAFERSKRMIVRDFAVLAAIVVAGVVSFVWAAN